MTIALTTPEQINAWVLLSRRSQCELHLKGIKVPGLLKAIHRDIPGTGDFRTVKAAFIAVCDYIGEVLPNAKESTLVNFEVWTSQHFTYPLFFHGGIFATMEEVAAYITPLADNGHSWVIGRTLSEPGPADPTKREMMWGPEPTVPMCECGNHRDDEWDEDCEFC